MADLHFFTFTNDLDHQSSYLHIVFDYLEVIHWRETFSFALSHLISEHVNPRTMLS